jgi:hypothetical protein
MRKLSVAGLALLSVAGCTPSETVFQSAFNTTPAGSPPAAQQTVGTARVFGAQGTVVAAASPTGNATNWLLVRRNNVNDPVNGMIGTFAAQRGPGTYHFINAMYLPPGLGLATLAFAPLQTNQEGEPLYFLHLDFGTPKGTTSDRVRIDDNPATDFGTFARNASFDVFVTLNTALTPPTADISIVGGGASGTAHYVLPATSTNLAQQFDQIEAYVGYPWTGLFYTDAINVRRDLP